MMKINDTYSYLEDKIEFLKEEIKKKSFEELRENEWGFFNSVYNEEDESFDFNFEDFSGTIYKKENGVELSNFFTLWSFSAQPIMDFEIEE